MLQVIAAVLFSFLIQLAICNTKTKVLIKLLPLFIEFIIFVVLVVFTILTTHQEAYYELRLMVGFYAFVVFVGITSIGLAWAVYGVYWAIYKR